MLTQRLLVAIILIPLFILIVAIGGWAYNLLITTALAIAAWEFWRIFSNGGYSPSRAVLILGVAALALTRALFGFESSDLLLALVIMLATAVHVFTYRSRVDHAAIDFCITLAGLFYLGWLGPYLISVRSLPDGEWWLLLVLPAVWAADSGAFSIGRRIGKHPMAPLVSPNKTWEGYFGGILAAAILAPMFALLWNQMTPEITPLRGLVIGLVLAVISPLGDLGESMLKRQFGVKDSGRLLPGHGGIFDRIDSWIWAAAIGYYLIVYLP